jgi:hypothetical protein
VTKQRSLPIAGFQPITHSENYFATLTNFLAQRKIIASVSYHANPADMFKMLRKHTRQFLSKEF